MDKIFVNEYEFTDDMIRETQQAYKKRNKSLMLNFIVSGLLGLYGLYMFVKHDNNYIYLGIVLLAAAVLIYFYTMERRAFKNEMDKMGELFEDASTRFVHYEMDDEVRIYLDDDDEPSCIVERRNMVGWTETENLIMLLCRNRPSIPFKKGCFIEGD